MPMYRTGFAHPLSLVHQCSKLLAETIYLFVRSESVLFGRTQIDKIRPALNSFVRVHCFQPTASCCNRSLNSFAILAKEVHARQQSLTAQMTLRPSCRLDNLPRLSSPRQVGGRLFDFSGCTAFVWDAPREVNVLLQSFSGCTPCRGQATRGGVCTKSFRQWRGVPQRERLLCWYSCSHKRGRLNERRRR